MASGRCATARACPPPRQGERRRGCMARASPRSATACGHWLAFSQARETTFKVMVFGCWLAPRMRLGSAPDARQANLRKTANDRTPHEYTLPHGRPRRRPRMSCSGR